METYFKSKLMKSLNKKKSDKTQKEKKFILKNYSLNTKHLNMMKPNINKFNNYVKKDSILSLTIKEILIHPILKPMKKMTMKIKKKKKKTP
jgi:hypothetical protein